MFPITGRFEGRQWVSMRYPALYLTPVQVRAYEAVYWLIADFLAARGDVPGTLMQNIHGFRGSTLALPSEHFVAQALRSHTASSEVCQALISPEAQLVLTVIGWEFPAWSPYLSLLIPAAKVLCKERLVADGGKVLLGIAGAVLLVRLLEALFA